MEFITQKIRSDICRTITNNQMMILSSQEIFSKDNRDINFELLLIDYYNTIMIKKSMGTLDNDDIKFLELINNNKVEELKWLITNFNFIKNSFIATVNFETLASLDKQHITQRAYEQKENNDLTNRLLYKINFIANNPSYKVEDLLKYYKEYIDINGDNIISHETGRDIILGYLKTMKETDLKCYEANVLAAISAFYKWGKYLTKERKQKLDITSKIFLKRIEWLKIDTLLELTKVDENFLEDIITQYLYFETITDNTDTKMDEFIDKSLSKRMKNKLREMKEKN